MDLSSLAKKLPKKELLLISFFITNSKGLKKIQSHWRKRNKTHSNFLGRSQEDTESIKVKELGGSITLIDPKSLEQGFIKEIQAPVATGMLFNSKKKTLLVGSHSNIKQITNGKIIGKFSHPLFNDIHTLTKGLNNNFLVASTGIDAILEFNLDNYQKTWDWLATESHYNRTPNGHIRKIGRDKDYRKAQIATVYNTTHINSCLEIKPNKCLAVLFHQGEIVEIEKDSKKLKVILSGLKCPHHIRKANNGFLVSDTLNKRVLYLNKKYKVIRKINGNFNWVQDALQLHNGNIVIGDSNNGRLVQTTIRGKILNELRWNKEKRRIGSFLKINIRNAKEIFN